MQQSIQQFDSTLVEMRHELKKVNSGTVTPKTDEIFFNKQAIDLKILLMTVDSKMDKLLTKH